MTTPSRSAPMPAPPAVDDPVAVARLQAAFARFAAHECPEDPLYAALCAAAARRPAWLVPLLAAKSLEQRPNLWLAAVHDRLLALHAAGEPRPALAEWFASVGGTRRPEPVRQPAGAGAGAGAGVGVGAGNADASPEDHALVAATTAFLAAHQGALRACMAAGATQTNEVGRGAVLWPVLAQVAELARRRGRHTLALLDLGASAGLNLGVDRWDIDWVAAGAGPGGGASDPDAERAPPVTLGAARPEPHPAGPSPILDCRVIGAPPPGLPRPGRPGDAPFRLHPRLGLDIAPVDVDDPQAVRWLQACLWPSDTGRRTRLDRAVAIAQAEGWQVQCVTDLVPALQAWQAELPAWALPVVFHSWVLTYLPPSVRAPVVDYLRAQAAAGHLVWIGAEAAALQRELHPGVAGMQAASPAVHAAGRAAGLDARALDEATLWVAAGLDDDSGAPSTRLLARSHAHGRWMAWEG